jgi:hypothetical protein
VFRGLINDAKSAAGAVIGKYAIRASVVVPFIIAAGFATAAGTLALIDRYGALMAYCLMAGVFAGIGLLASIFVAVREQEEVAADTKADQADTANVATDAAAQAAVQVPLALLGTLLTTPMGPGMAAGGLKAVARNLPLVILMVLIGFLFWPSSDTAADGGESTEDNPDQPSPQANPADWQPMRNGADHRPAA